MSSILNAAGSALAGIATVGGALQGSSLAQPNLSILGVNVPGIPLISFRDYFLASMESWVTALPLRTQFIALFDRFPPGLTTNLLQNLEPVDAARSIPQPLEHSARLQHGRLV